MADSGSLIALLEVTVARIVCQVLHRLDRITFLWSEGGASFEPYHLEGAESAQLLQIAGQIHAPLAAADNAKLVNLGHQLYRAVFRRDASERGSADGIQAWLAKLSAGNSIERLEFLSDSPGLIPWNVLLDEADSAPKGFWGARFNLGAGRRVNALRQSPTQVQPTQLFAADRGLVDQLPADRQLKPGDAGKLVNRIPALRDEIKESAPDILMLLVRCEKGMLHLGADSFSIDELAKWLDEPKEGNPDPLIILMGCGSATEHAAWQAILGAAGATFSGLVANETLLNATQAFEVGHALAQRFAEGKQNLGEILQTLRQENASALAFSAFCPPQLRVVTEGASDAPEAENQIEVAPLPRLPYRPFAAFDAADRALFFGREDDVLHGALTADHPDAIGVLLHGSPAVGKTSYLQAGLLPYLEQECVGYRVLRDRSPDETPVAEKDYPILILRCTNDLAGQFADALSVFCAQPLTYTTPAGTQVTIDLPSILQQVIAGTTSTPSTAIQSASATAITSTPSEAADDEDNAGAEISARELWIALRDNKELLTKLLDVVTRSLPFELVIAIDQGEELLMQVRSPQQQDRRQKALDMLTHLSHVAPRCKIVFTIRSQFLGQFVSLFPNGETPANWRTFYLRPLSQTELVDALLWPTNREEIPYCGEVPYQKYGFAFEDGMATQIVADIIEAAASEQQGPLPILQATGALLYERQVMQKKQDVVRVGDVKDFGGVKEALTKYLDQSLEGLPITKQSRQALRELIAKLYISHEDGTLSRDVLLASDLKNHWNPTAEPVEPVVNLAADQQGLFDIQQLLIGGQQDVYVSLPQDSLAQLGKKIEREKTQQALARTKVIDVLWIMIPLMFLAAAMTFWFTRNYISGGGQADVESMREEIIKELRKRAQEAVEEGIRDVHASTRRPLYYGQIVQADQALRAGNALRARQILLSQPAMRSVAEEKLNDVRGFEWKYLWKQLNSERHLLEGHQSIVTSVAVSPDGKLTASASIDGTVRIWNLSNGEIVALIPGSKSAVHAVAFAPDGKSLASAGADKIVRVWDISHLKTDYVVITKETKALPGHTDTVHALAFGKDANTLASAGADKTVILWDVSTGKDKKLTEHAAAVQALAFTLDGKTLVSAGDEAKFFVYDADTGKKRLEGTTDYRAIASIAISSDGKTLCTGGVEARLDAEQGMIRFWNLADVKETLKPIAHSTGILAVAFGADGKTVAAGGKDPVVRSWNVQTGVQKHHWIGHLGAVRSLAFAKDDAALISGSFDSTVKVWDPAQSSGPEVIQAHADWVQALVLNGKNTLLASGSRDGTVKIWDPKSSKLLKELPSHKGAVTSLAFSNHKEKDAAYLAVGTRDEKNKGEIKLWRIESDAKQGFTFKEHQTLKEQENAVTCLAFHPSDEKADILISGSTDKTVKVWDIKAGKLTQTHTGHTDEVRCIAFSFDNVSFASGGKDALVCFYELESKEIRKLTDMHLGSIEAIKLFQAHKFREDAHEVYTGILTGSTDLTTRLWGYEHLDRNAVGNKNLILERSFRNHTQAITSVSFNEVSNSPIISASWDGTIRIHDQFAERLSLTGHQGAVRAIAVAGDQSFVASAGNDGTIRIWRTTPERGALKVEMK
jgi:WD40 repeat protein